MITDGARRPDDGAIYVVWRRGDGLVSASRGRLPKDERPPWTFVELLTTGDWDAARMLIRAMRTAIVMNQDLWPISKSAESNLLGVLI